jgi:lactose/L-arabinose transport system ATP-binding protein
MTLADKIVVLRDGVIEQVGTPREVYEHPANTFVAGFIGSPRMNLIGATGHGNGKVLAAEAEIAVPSIAAANSGNVTVGLRPEHLVLSAQAPGTLKATVDFFEYLGGTRYLYCQLPDGQSLVAEQRDGEDLAAGQTVHFTWKPKDLRLFDTRGLKLV